MTPLPSAQDASSTPLFTRMFLEASLAFEAVVAQGQGNQAIIERIAARLRAQPPRAVVTCARGSSDHAATYAKYMIETRCGVLTSSAAPSVSSVYSASADLRDVLFLAISQSGRSPDLLAAVNAARRSGAYVVVLVNDEDSPLARLADDVIPLRAGPELSVAATKSYIAALAAILHLVANWTQDPALVAALRVLPKALQLAWDQDWTPALSRLGVARNLYVLGRGVGFGIAQEAALKLKETCGLHAEAFSTAEVLHGPMALIKDGFPVLAFVQNDETLDGALAIVDRVVAQGGDLMLAGAKGVEGGVCLATQSAHPAIEPILMIQSFYRMANALSLSRGFNPDTPPNLQKVTETV